MALSRFARYVGFRQPFGRNALPLSKTFSTHVNLAMSTVLTEGGDDRLTIHPSTGKNQYNCFPEPDTALFRGSCTCNTPTVRAFKACEEAYDEFTSNKRTVEQTFDDIRARLSHIFNLPEGTGVLLCPSGSDAEYFPLLFTQLLNPQKPVVNMVTCFEEVGAGTKPAAGGLNFSCRAPLPDHYGMLEADGVVGMMEQVTVVSVNARETSGEVIDANGVLQETLSTIAADKNHSTRPVPIVHSVFGSKTGLRQVVEARELKQVQELNGVHVVDACQGRFDTSHLHEWLADPVTCVLITGSKFYRGPPFSGAVLVSPVLMSRLAEIPPDVVAANMPAQGLSAFITEHELPRSLPQLRQSFAALSLPDKNMGLALRWIAALAEMEAVNAMFEKTPSNSNTPSKDQVEQQWRARVLSAVEDHPNLDAFDSNETATIVSIRIRHPTSGGWLNKAQMAKIYVKLTQELDQDPHFLQLPNYASVKDILKQKCVIGQPVFISPNEAVLRLALGADSLTDAMQNMDQEVQVDERILLKMQLLAEQFEAF